MNIVDSIIGFGGVGLRDEMARFLGIMPNLAQRGMAAAVPGVLAAIINAITTKSGADAFGSSLSRLEPNALDGFRPSLRDDPTSLAQQGSDLLRSILGDADLGALGDKLASHVGTPSAATHSLLGLVGSIVLGYLRREVGPGAVDAASVVNGLIQEKDQVLRALPDDLAHTLRDAGLLGLILPLAAPARQRSPAHVPGSNAAPERSGGIPWGWAAGFVALALIAWLVWPMLRGADVDELAQDAAERVEQVTAGVVESAHEAARQIEQVAGAAADTAEQATQAVTDALTVDVGASVTKGLDDAMATLTQVTDAAAGKAALPDLVRVRDGLRDLEEAAAALGADGVAELKTLVDGSLPAFREAAGAALAAAESVPGLRAVIDEIEETIQRFTVPS